MNREELLTLCNLYVRQRGLGSGVIEVHPALQIIDSFLHAEISESEKNSLLAFVRVGEDEEENDQVGELAGLGTAPLDDSDDERS